MNTAFNYNDLKKVIDQLKIAFIPAPQFYQNSMLNGTNTVLKVGAHKWYYPDYMDWTKEIMLLEIPELEIDIQLPKIDFYKDQAPVYHFLFYKQQ